MSGDDEHISECSHSQVCRDGLEWRCSWCKELFVQEFRLQDRDAKFTRIRELAVAGRTTSQFTHARAALDEIIKLIPEPPK